jgi:hypothetical protein
MSVAAQKVFQGRVQIGESESETGSLQSVRASALAAQQQYRQLAQQQP